MGLDATVRCRCYAEGRARPFSRPELIRLDPRSGPRLASSKVDDAVYDEYLDWCEVACEHPNFEYVSERIANWSGYRALREALERMGWLDVPTLLEVLPDQNQGFVSPADSARCLEELDRFEAKLHLQSVTTLVDGATNQALCERVAGYDGVFVQGPGVEVGLGLTRLFVRRDGAEVFSATDVEQRPLGPDPQGPHELRDPYSDARVELPWPVQGGVPRMQVEFRERSPADFHNQLTALRKVFAASVETGMPVEWC